MADAAAPNPYGSYPTVTNKLMPPPDPMQQAGQTVAVAQGIQQLSAAHFDLAHKQLGATNQIMASIAQDPSDDNIANLSVTAANMGIPAPMIAQEIGTLSGLPLDQRKQRALQHISMNLDAAGQLTAAVGSPNTFQTGDRQVTMAVNPLRGTVTPMAGPGADIPNEVGPAGRMQTQDTVTQGGAKVAVPAGQLYDNRGNFVGVPVSRGGASAPRTASSGAAAQPAPTAPAPPISAPPNASAPSPAPDAPAASPGGMVTQLSPSTTADQAASTQQFTTQRDDLGPSRMRTFALQQALGALRNTNTGGGTAYRQGILNAINALPGGIGKTIVPDSSSLSDYDLAKKYLGAYALQQQGAGRSDSALSATQAANANTDMTNPAAIDVALNNIGQEKMRQAQAIGFIQSHGDPNTFANHIATEWGSSNDPKAFALGAMTAQERASYFAGLKGQAKTTFLNSVRKGLSTGIITQDDLQGASGGQQ